MLNGRDIRQRKFVEIPPQELSSSTLKAIQQAKVRAKFFDKSTFDEFPELPQYPSARNAKEETAIQAEIISTIKDKYGIELTYVDIKYIFDSQWNIIPEAFAHRINVHVQWFGRFTFNSNYGVWEQFRDLHPEIDYGASKVNKELGVEVDKQFGEYFKTTKKYKEGLWKKKKQYYDLGLLELTKLELVQYFTDKIKDKAFKEKDLVLIQTSTEKTTELVKGLRGKLNLKK